MVSLCSCIFGCCARGAEHDRHLNLALPCTANVRIQPELGNHDQGLVARPWGVLVRCARHDTRVFVLRVFLRARLFICVCMCVRLCV